MTQHEQWTSADIAEHTRRREDAPATTPLTREQAAIIGAFTGVSAGPFSDVQDYAERVLGRPIMTHEFASRRLEAELKEAAREDFIRICASGRTTT